MSFKSVRADSSRLLILGITMGLTAGLCGSNATAQPSPAPAGADPTLAPYASAKQSVHLADGRALHLVCMGQGSPVVILSAGAGNWSIIWNKVQPAIAEKTRVCAWDRAGFGFSAPSRKSQTVADTTSDLQAALKIAGIGGPYIAVGHSLGGFETLLLKDREPSKVVGMVLVDPSVPDQAAILDRVAPALAEWNRSPDPATTFLRQCAAALRAGTVRRGGPDPDGCLRAPPMPANSPELRAALEKQFAEATTETIAANMDAYASIIGAMDVNSTIVIEPGRNYGRMPLIVLTAGDDAPPPDLPAADKPQYPLWTAAVRRAHDDLAALSTRGVNRMVPDSSHYIQQIKPQVVIDAIDEVVDEARASRRTQG